MYLIWFNLMARFGEGSEDQIAERFCRIVKSAGSSKKLVEALSTKKIIFALGLSADLLMRVVSDLSVPCPYAPNAQGVEK
jgi:hypothetical protein